MSNTTQNRQQIQIPLITSHNVSKGKSNLNTPLVNWYPVTDPDNQAIYKTYWYPTPGLSTYLSFKSIPSLAGIVATLSTSRGAFKYKNYLFVALANFVASIDLDSPAALGTFTNVMTMSTNGSEAYANTNGAVKFAAIENQVVAVDGSSIISHYNIATGTKTQINLNTAFSREVFASTVSAQDGFFIINNKNTNEFFISNINDGTTWNPLANAFANTTGDPIVGIVSYKAKLYFIGQQSTEVWFNASSNLTSTTDFIMPFEKVQGATIKYGSQAENSIVTSPESILFLSENAEGQREVISITDYQVTPLSTIHIVDELNTLSVSRDADAFIYQQDGIYFYQLSFPTEDQTFCCNIAGKFWFKKDTWYNNRYGVHRAKWQIYANGINICGDRYSLNLLSMSSTVYQDVGEKIRRVGVSPLMFYNNKNFKLANLYIDCSVGEGLATDLATEPLLQVQFSKNGVEWGVAHLKSLGRTGDYDKKVVFGRLGSQKMFQVKLEYTDNGFCAIYGMTANVVIQDDYSV